MKYNVIVRCEIKVITDAGDVTARGGVEYWTPDDPGDVRIPIDAAARDAARLAVMDMPPDLAGYLSVVRGSLGITEAARAPMSASGD